MRPGCISMKALPDEAWLALVWRLFQMRPGKQWCRSSAQLGLAGVGVETLTNEAWLVGIEALPDEAWLALVWRLCLMRPGRR